VAAERGVRNPVVRGALIHLTIFVVLLVALITQVIRAPYDAGVIVAVIAPLTVVVIISAGITLGVANRRSRLKLVEAANPNAVIVRTDWSSAVLQSFVKPGEALDGADYRGFGVDIAADRSGLSFLRGKRSLVRLGFVPWGEVRSITVGKAHAVLGSRTVATVIFEIDANDTLSSPIELIVRDQSATVAVAQLGAQRPGEYTDR
jgi:hypothetical protein